MSSTDVAQQLNERGREADRAGRRDEAVELYRQAAAADPSWTAPLYNLGLVYKYEGNWKLSLDFNRAAIALDPKHEAALWNLGIAATALGDWHAARQAWRDYGIELPDGEGPIDLPCGRAPIRLNPSGDAEVVWSDRIDPARAVLASIPYAESGHGWRDLVLNDGAPNGFRFLDGQEVAVFDELQHLQGSKFGTYLARVVLHDLQFDTARLCEISNSLDGAAEDWTTSVRILCKQCSEGRPHAKHDEENRVPDRDRTVAVAATSHDHAARIVRAWETEVPALRVESLRDALEPSRQN